MPLLNTSLMLVCSLPTLAAPAGSNQDAISNSFVRITPIIQPAGCVGIRVTCADKPVAAIHLGPGDVIRASRQDVSTDSHTSVLRLTGLSVPGNAVQFSADSVVTIRLTDACPWPTIAFDLALEAFDAAAWQQLVGGTLPFHFLVCELPGATMFYQGGGMIPCPEVDPFPITARGFMAGEWAPGWTYAPALAAWAVPAVGLWDHRNATFVAYDLNEQRHTDRSGEMLASAGVLMRDAPVFCFVHPHQSQWVKLTYPAVPSRAASHFELIYTFDLPASADPNQFVLERLWREKRALLPRVPRMNDLAWIPEYDGFAPGGDIAPTAVGSGLIWHSGPSGLEGAFVESGATMLGNDFIADGCLRALSSGRPDPLQTLRRDLEFLMDRCTWVDIRGDRCATWMHPLDGQFQDRWGGTQCAGNHHPSTFQIGAGMLMLYQQTHDPRLLPYIDGVFHWCKHYLFTRNGVCDLPWAMFSREATAVGENFLLTYRKVLRDDPVRSHNAAEALALARTAVYKNLWFYTADPDPSDDLDPTFLNQATNDCRWAGRATWNEAGWVLRTMVPVYCETGDPFLKYLIRGSVERYYAGFRDDGGIAENLQFFGEIEPKGARTGGFPDAEHGGNIRRYARPLAPAILRVAVGERAALAFCLGTRRYDVEEYRYAPQTSFSFRLVGLPGAAPEQAIDLVVTAPFRDLRGQTVSVDGTALPADRYDVNPLTAGEDVFICGVKPGAVIQIGPRPDTAAAPPADEGIPYRDGPVPCAAPWQTVDLRAASNTSLDTAWWQPASWYGLAPGRRVLHHIPVDVVDPATNAGRCAVTHGAIPVGKSACAIFAVLGRERAKAPSAGPIGVLRVTLADGDVHLVRVDADTPRDLTNGFPLRQFDTYLVALDIGTPKLLESIAVEAGTLLCLTLAESPSADVRAALSQAAATRYQTLAAQTLADYQAPSSPSTDDHPWATGLTQPWRFHLTVLPASVDRTDVVLRAHEDFATLLRQVGAEGTVHPQSLQAIETTPSRDGQGVPVQFDPLSATDTQRGELFLIVPGLTAAGEARGFDIYFGPDAVASTPAVNVRLSTDRVRVTTGPGGLRFEFALDADAGHPRWIDLAFDRHGDLETAPNLLGPSGFNGGLADITTCTDYVTWYDFGGLQDTPARAEIVSAGPVATTVRICDLQLWGQGEVVRLGAHEGRPFGAAPAGSAAWSFRFFAGQPVVEQWLDLHIDRPDHGWTRALQVRYGLQSWQQVSTRTVAGRSVAVADQLAVAALPNSATTIAPECMATGDGNVLQVAFTRPDAIGDYFSGSWLTLPAALADAPAIVGTALKQYAVEVRAEGRINRRAPEPAPSVAFDRTAGLGPGPRPHTILVPTDPTNLCPDPSFEQQEVYWALGSANAEARWTTTQVYSGHVGVDLSCTDKSIALVATNQRGSYALSVAPNATYEVRFQALCTAGEGEVHVNFFGPAADYDFHHVRCRIPRDGRWHQIKVEVPTGDFSPGPPQPNAFTRQQRLAPALRLWTLHKVQSTYVDQVEVRRLR